MEPHILDGFSKILGKKDGKSDQDWEEFSLAEEMRM
jgi:hypothetical protein